MASDFKELKRASNLGEGLRLLRSQVGYNLGTHKTLKLRRAGIGSTRSLLQDEVSRTHAGKLFKEFQSHTKRLGGEAKSRLRFLTILHSVEPLDDKLVRAAIATMERAYNRVLCKAAVWSRGAIELEIVNLTLLRRIGELDDDEKRKLNVLTNLVSSSGIPKRKLPRTSNDTRVLIHLHSVVDLGSDYEESEKGLRNLLGKTALWNRSPYQIELKKLFGGIPALRSLKKIAEYITKGGNDTLRYNAGFRRDLAGDLDAKMWREGFGRSDRGAETVEDERGLTVGEVEQLDQFYLWLMKRRRDTRGYILSTP